MKHIKANHLCRPDGRLLVIPFVEKGPWIDGKLNDPAWKTAVSYGRFLDATAYFQHRYDISSINPGMFDPEPALAPAVPGTKVLLCHDRAYLYATFICHDPCPAEIRRRDHGFGNFFNRLTREDCVYLWLDPVLEHVRPSVLEYIVNAAGQKSECIRGSYSGDLLSLMAWEGRVTIGKDSWIAEIMLPLERLGLDAANKNVFGLNLGRGYRGDWRTHVLFKPDGDFLPGWAFAVLEGKSAKALKRGIARIN
ncbi:MAG: hypothetical protein L6437_04855, partial [Kiritimatiellae bacterium]|nr:hypothetical protein [Kiritimatiellia bacterium]